MALIQYVKKENASGKIAETYKMIEERINILPNVIQFHSASPELFPRVTSFLEYFIDHPSIDTITIAYIRLLISYHGNGEYCVRFQTAILKYLGLSEEDIELAKKDYRNINLDEKNKALVVFVLDMMTREVENTKKRMEELKNLGWAEKDIYEASILGALQKGMIEVVKTFEVEIDF